MPVLSTLKTKAKNFLLDPTYKTLDRQLQVRINPGIIQLHGYPHPLYFKCYKNYIPQFYISYVNTRIPFIIPKDYQPDLSLFSNFKTYNLIKNIWDNHLKYTDTDEYREMTELIKKGDEIRIKERVIKTMSDLNTYFKEYVKLLQSMDKQGYNEKIGQDDILIWIGPDGELIKDTKSGRHRLAAAQVIGLNEIPVRINHVHQLWIESKLSSEKFSTENLSAILKEKFQ